MTYRRSTDIIIDMTILAADPWPTIYPREKC